MVPRVHITVAELKPRGSIHQSSWGDRRYSGIVDVKHEDEL
jgi:hypothetical protein